MRTPFFLNSVKRVALGLTILGCFTGAPAWSQSGMTVSPQSVSDSAVDAYLIHVGDTIDVTVLGHDELKSTLTVLPDGSITFPIAGRIRAAGLSTSQLAAALDNGLKSQCNQPQATVSIEQVAAAHVNVLGSVHSPGVHDLRPGERVLSLIADSGGLDGDAALMQATLVTDQGAKSVPIDIQAMMSGADMSDNRVVQPDDILILQRRDPAYDQIQVIGEVVKPSAYSIPVTGEPLLRAITDAGGTTPNAALSRAQLLHGGVTKTLDLRAINASLSSAEASVILVPGDVLMIPTNTARVAVIGGVHSPSTYTIPDGQPLSVSDALAMAGGTVQDADVKKAMVLHHTSAGTVEQIPVNVDPLATTVQAASNSPNGQPQIALASNTYLSPSDIVYVPERAPKTRGNGVLDAVTPISSILLAAAALF